MKKSILSYIFLICVALCLTACGGGDDTDKDINKDATYKIEWVIEGSVVETDNDVKYDTTPEYNGAVPTKEETASTIYTFKEWSPAVTKATKNQTYTAVFNETTKTYKISFYKEDGTLLSENNFNYGATPSYNYVKNDTAEYDYTVEGWATSQNGSKLNVIPTVTQEAKYYAVVKAVKQKYSITFESNGGSAVTKITNDYGVSIPKPTKPTYDGYSFVSWCYDSELKNSVVWPLTLTKDLKLYAVWNEQIPVKEYLATLLNGYELNPFSMIPETMSLDYSNNLIQPNGGVYDFSSNVNVSAIKYGGFGEQWNMVNSNINQSKTFFNALAVVETISSGISVAFNNYIDGNPSDTSSYTFKEGIYNVTIKFEDGVILLVLDYSANFPVFGQQTAQIYLDYNIETLQRTCRIQLGDANALKYEINKNSYNFGIRYLGVRRAYFEIEKKADNSVEGAIFEFIGIDEKVSVSSSAQFLITKDYVSVVGNKAGGMIGFTGYINELYSTSTGKLLSYEVREELSSITYNTLWFNLSDVSGITSIRQETVDDKLVNYLNGSNQAFVTKKVGGLGLKMLSRRFDIELRTQYFYYYDSANDAYVEVASSVPMLFVQEENLSTFSADVKSVNSSVTASVTLNNDDLTKVQQDYDTMIDIFITNKENVKAEDILTYIGSKV